MLSFSFKKIIIDTTNCINFANIKGDEGDPKNTFTIVLRESLEEQHPQLLANTPVTFTK